MTKCYLACNYGAALHFTVLSRELPPENTAWKQECNLPVEKNHQVLIMLIKCIPGENILLKLNEYVQALYLTTEPK